MFTLTGLHHPSLSTFPRNAKLPSRIETYEQLGFFCDFVGFRFNKNRKRFVDESREISREYRSRHLWEDISKQLDKNNVLGSHDPAHSLSKLFTESSYDCENVSLVLRSDRLARPFRRTWPNGHIFHFLGLAGQRHEIELASHSRTALRRVRLLLEFVVHKTLCTIPLIRWWLNLAAGRRCSFFGQGAPLSPIQFRRLNER